MLIEYWLYVNSFTKKYYIYSDQHKQINYNLSILQCQDHACCWSGNTRSQVISSKDIDLIILENSALKRLAHSLTLLLHLPLDKMAAISQMIFSDALLWMKIFVFWLKFHWSLFLSFQMTKAEHWFRKQVPSHYLNQCWPNSLTHICATRGRGVKLFLWITEKRVNHTNMQPLCLDKKYWLSKLCWSFYQ